MSLIIKNNNNLEKKILNAEDRIEKIKNILSDIANNANNISVLNNEMDTANTNIAKNAADISNLNNEMDTANANITKNAADISVLNDEMDTANDNIAKNAADISDLNNEVNTANANIAKNAADISDLNDEIDTANDNIAKNATDIDKNTTDIAKNTADIADNTTDIANLTAQINANQAPIIDSTSWNDNNHKAGNNYILTITAHDPDSSNTIIYNVTCDDTNVNISQNTTNKNIFTITYPSYNNDTTVNYTISVTDSQNATNSIVLAKTVSNNANQAPIIDNVFWNDNNHKAGNSYTLSITSHDPDDGDIISYTVTCNDSNINIVQNTIDKYKFTITYPNYNNDVTITYIVTITDNHGASDSTSLIKTVSNNANQAPVIDSTFWDDNDILTITAHDPDSNDTLSYSVTCDNGVNAIQDSNNPNKFTMECPEFNSTTVVSYTITVTDNHGASDSVTKNRIIDKTIIERGLFGGGFAEDSDIIYNGIGYITISTLGNANHFGDLTISRARMGAASNGNNDRGIFGGGYDEANNNLYNIIDYVTISSLGNALDFGDLQVARGGIGATSNSTNNRGVFGGGFDGGKSGDNGYKSIIEVKNISTLGNSSQFGDLSLSRWALTAISNGINDRGVFGGGFNYPWVESTSDYSDLSPENFVNIMDYITISTSGNAQDFGDLTVGRWGLAATSNSTNERGVFAGGCSHGSTASIYTNIIDYMTISNLSNAQDFGDLTFYPLGLAATSNGTKNRGVFAGGHFDPDSEGTALGYSYNNIDYITISTLGNAQDFGDLSKKRRAMSGISNSN